MAGRLIVIEGADGLGKSTQLARLIDRVRGLGREVATYDFPNKSGTPIGELIGGFLAGRFGQVTPEFVALAFAADRLAERDRLRADLDAGKVVLCDRFVRSNIAYQSAKIDDPDRRAKLEEMLFWLEYQVMGLPRPDLEIALVADPDHFAAGRHLARGDDATRDYAGGAADIHEASTDLQTAVNDYYRTAGDGLRALPILDGARRRTADELGDEVWALVEPLL